MGATEEIEKFERRMAAQAQVAEMTALQLILLLTLPQRAELVKSLALNCDELQGQNADAETTFAAAIDLVKSVSVACRDTVEAGTDENLILKAAGVTFRCNCGCNVFRRVFGHGRRRYMCNGCSGLYRGD